MCDVVSDFFDERYFKIMKFVNYYFGTWPFLPKVKRIRAIIISSFLLWCGMGNMIAAPFIGADNCIETLLQVLPPVATIIAVTCKYVNLIIHRQTLRSLFTKIYGDHVKKFSSEHLPILQNHSEKGRQVMHFYTYYILFCMSLFLLFPYAPIFMDCIIPLNESRRKSTLFPTVYGIDIERIYPFVMIHQSTHAMMVIFLILCADNTMTAITFHSCGLFAVAGYQLRHFADHIRNSTCPNLCGESETLKDSRNVAQTCNSKLVLGLKLHIDALDFAERARLCFSTTLGIVVIMNMILISITFFQVVMKQGQWELQITAVIYTVGQFIHLFYLSFNGQILNNISEEVKDSIYECAWYNLPPETQKMVSLALMEAQRPTYLTAGHFFVLKMDTFSAILQTSMSYFMVLVNTT